MDTDENKQKSKSVDVIKVVLCILIIASHCLPVFYRDCINYYYGQWFFRFSVPFFFISTGYFFYRMNEEKRRTYIERIGIIYFIASILYAPLVVRGGWRSCVKNLFLGYYHLWYLSALIYGLIIIFILGKTINKNVVLKYLMPIFFLCVGIFIDEYQKMFDLPIIERFSEYINYIGGARHTMFFALPMLFIGQWIAEAEQKQKQKHRLFLLVVSFFLLLFLGFIEVIFLEKNIGEKITLDVSFFGWTPAIPLFLFGIKYEVPIKPKVSRFLRKITDIVYIVHIWVLIILTRVFHFEFFTNFFLTVLFSFIVAIGIELIFCGIRKRKEYINQVETIE